MGGTKKTEWEFKFVLESTKLEFGQHLGAVWFHFYTYQAQLEKTKIYETE